MHIPLLLSLLALLIGPVLYGRMRYGRAAAAVDAFALVAVSGLVFANILPQSFALAGWAAIPVALVGLLGPGLLCGTKLLSGRSAGRVTMPLALAGIALHAMLDGIVLGSNAGGNAAIAVAVVLHRVPDGLGIWWLARPAFGRRAAMALIAATAFFTVVGFAFQEPLVSGTSQSWFALFQALVAGSLLHVIFKHPPSMAGADSAPAGTRLASGIGGFLGIVLVLALERWHGGVRAAADAHGGAHGDAWDTFLALTLDSAPALLGAYAAVALVHGLRLDLPRLLGRGSTFSQALRGTVVGLPLAICSCGVIPLYRGLIQQRVPMPAGMSFLVAAPELGIAALFLSWRLLGSEITVARAASALLLALVVGILVGRKARVAPDVPFLEPPGTTKPPLGERLKACLRYGFGDMVDATGPWILVGITVAAVLEPLLRAEDLAQLPPLLGVPLFALVGMPLFVCASGSTPLAAMLIAKGASPGAAIAFLLTGPATNVTTFGVLARLHDRRTALAFAAAVAVTTVLLGYGVDLALSGTPGTSLVHVGEHESGALAWTSLVVLAALFLVSLLRQGTRGFVAQVITPHGQEHRHDHHDEEGHDHEDGRVTCADPTVA